MINSFARSNWIDELVIRRIYERDFEADVELVDPFVRPSRVAAAAALAERLVPLEHPAT